MSKPSGWKKYKDKQPIKGAAGVMAKEMMLVERDKINVKETRQAASDLAEGQRHDNTKLARQEAVQYVASVNKISDQEAERLINRTKARQARAVLAAADKGEVKLPASQRQRLQDIAQGDYLEQQAPQFRAAQTRSSEDEQKRRAREEKAAEFRQDIKRRGVARHDKEPPILQTPAAPAPKAIPVVDRPIERKADNPFAALDAERRAARGQAPAGRAHVRTPERKNDNPFASAKVAAPISSQPARPAERKNDNPFAALDAKRKAAAEKPPEPSQSPFSGQQGVTEQADMFGGTKVVKKERGVKLGQIDMFKSSEVGQFGVSARPQASLGEGAKLRLMQEDRRTDEERQRDAQRAAESRTTAFF